MPPVPTVTATRTTSAPPTWAILERELFAVQDKAWRTFAGRYTDGAGRLIFRDTLGVGLDGRDGVDDFYEPFFNWPTLYLLGGSADILAAAHRHWQAVTDQLAEMSMLHERLERGYDWFHQGEGMLLFYGLCLARPDDADLRTLATRFADFYLPGGPNYDPEHRVIRAPHNGSEGPRWGFSDEEAYFPWSLALRPYGLPLDWIDEAAPFDELAGSPERARAYGRAMWDRMGRGDTLVNLASTSLVTNAYLLSGDRRYADWVAEYAGAWRDRLSGHEVIPDNAGLTGVVGEYLDGRWYGGHYGWAWPHGVHSVGMAALVGALNAATVTGDHGYLEIARNPLDTVMRHGEQRTADQMGTLGRRWRPHLAAMPADTTFMVPQRHDDSGWFDFTVLPNQLTVSLWHFSRDSADHDRVERLRELSNWDWTTVHTQRLKDEAGHEEPWWEFLAGRNPGFPERMLRSALETCDAKVTAIEADPVDPATGPSALDIHHWQDRNPIVTEALLQLTTGSPQILYNGGLAQLHVRYHDADLRRPGLPDDVAALVSDISPDHTVVDLVNVGGTPRSVVVQAGTYAEHELRTVGVDDDAPQPVEGRYVTVRLPAQTQVRLTLTLTLRAVPPMVQTPWEDR
ncbi:hypothetical protein HDA40_002734 [Hamadaea flava]|uniref:Linalool dehydratase/isomerase domain-containing protein n=1 Tax=Hamadaea flava TaxID=1742688 RepID=A0ABV8LIA2_9ACTN|nr:hypothetical protein [Hamadaea flava]MCP2324227.1 hypothetical protein [Hamadaea flava]